MGPSASVRLLAFHLSLAVAGKSSLLCFSDRASLSQKWCTWLSGW